MAVFISTPSQPSSIATDASLAVPTPASTSTGTLAFSTISQIGYMVLALGVGAWSLALFHFFTHAFFKALLFLSAGSIIHALHGEQNIYNMGGLRKSLPKVYYCMLAGAAALAGIPARVEAASTWMRGRSVDVHGPQACTGVTDGLDANGFLRVRTAQGLTVVQTGGMRAKETD